MKDLCATGFLYTTTIAVEDGDIVGKHSGGDDHCLSVTMADGLACSEERGLHDDENVCSVGAISEDYVSEDLVTVNKSVSDDAADKELGKKRSGARGDYKNKRKRSGMSPSMIDKYSAQSYYIPLSIIIYFIDPPISILSHHPSVPTEKFHTTGRSAGDKQLLRQYMRSGVDRYHLLLLS